MTEESRESRYARIVKAYRKRFGELPPRLLTAGEGVDLYLDLMEQAIAGKRGRVTEADLGYPPGADL